MLEEIVFRGILQGWLRRTSLSGHLTLLTVTILFVAINLAQFDPAQQAWEFSYTDLAPTGFVLALAIGYGCLMYYLARRFGLSEAEIQHWQPALHRNDL